MGLEVKFIDKIEDSKVIIGLNLLGVKLCGQLALVLKLCLFLDFF